MRLVVLAWSLPAFVAGAALLGCSSSPTDRPAAAGAAGDAMGTGGASATGGSANTGGSGGGNAAGTGGAPAGTGGASATGGSGAAEAGPGADASGPTAEGGPSGTGPCGAAGVIVCDDFETTNGTAPDPTKWMPYSSSDPSLPAPALDATKFFGGTHSVRTQGTSSGLGSFLVPVAMLPANNRFYVRARVHFEKDTSAMTGHDAFIVGAESRDQSGTELRLGISSSSNSPPMLDLNLQSPKDGGGEVTRFSNGSTTGGDLSAAPGFSFVAGSPDRWYCVEALFSGTGGVGEFDVWIDGAEIPTMHVTDFKARPTDPSRTTWAPTFKYIKIGAQNYSGDIGKIWYDDVAVGSQRIGCN